MDNQENTQPNIQESDNQLLIDFIKDTYTIEYTNQHFFLFKTENSSYFFEKKVTNEKFQQLSNDNLNNNLLHSNLGDNSIDDINNTSDTFIASKYNLTIHPLSIIYNNITSNKEFDEYLKNILEEYKKDFSSTVLNKHIQRKHGNVLTLFQNIFSSNDNIRQQIVLLSIYYYNKSIFTSYQDARNFLNTYIKDYNRLDVFKQRLFDKTYVDNHFFMWFYIRYYINRTIPDNSLKKSKNNIVKYYPRIKEAALLGICNKSKLQENKDKAMFNACLDIFQVLNFTFSNFFRPHNNDLLDVPIDATCYQVITDTYGQQVDALAKTITFSENIKSNLLTISDIGGTKQENENEILDCNSIDIILKPFKDYIVSKIKPKLDAEWQGYINQLKITNIFATINPNFYSFKKGVNNYKDTYYENRVVLLFVKLNDIMQIRFDEILETKCKIIVILYDEINGKDSINNSNNSSNDKWYLIECAGMTSQNIRIFFYDTELTELISLYGESELALDENNKIPTGVFSNNQDIKVEYNSFQNVLLLYYRNIVFKFINYKAVLNEQGIAGITLKNNIQTSKEAKNQPSPNEIKIITTVIAIDDEIIQEYVKDLPFYMFIKLTEEIITGKLNDVKINDNNKLQLTYEFTCRLLKEISDNDVRFSFVKKSFFYTNRGYGADKHVGAASLNYKDNKYNVNINFNFSNLPDRVYIRNVIPLSYDGYSLKAEVKLEIINQTKSIEDIDKCIIWKYVLLDKDMKEVHIPVQNALSLTDMYDNCVDKVTGRILDISFMEAFMMHLYGEYNTPQQAIAFIPSIEGLGPYQDFICSKYAIVLGYNGSSKGVTSSSSQIFYASNDSYIDLQAFHEPYLDNKNIKYTHWICKVNGFEDKPLGYTEKHTTNIIENKNTLKPDEMLNLLYKDEEMYKLPGYGRNVRVYYREEWFGKKIFFYPLNKLLKHRIVEIWNIEQPISLKFNGEQLQIIEEGKILKEYEARSGQMENRNLATNNGNILTQQDNKTVNDNQTQDNTTISLDMLDINDNGDSKLKAVHYPGYSAGNTLNLEKDEKFYYGDKAKYRIEEGEYYIFANKITDYDGGSFIFRQNKINKVGNRYVRIHKNLQGDTTEFSAEDEKMLIHGGTNYEDNGGIDLSEYSEDFFKYLEYIVKEKYCDKLYKVAGNIPIRLIVKYGANYLDDLANSPIGFLIGKIESRNDYGTYNYKHNGRYRAKFGGGIDKLTVAEVMAKHASGEIFAAGRFQVIPSTLKEAVTFLGIDTNKKFDKEMQDYICSKYLLTEKQPDIKAYLFGDGDIHQAMFGLAREFASFPVPNGMTLKSQRISDGTKSYYDGDGHNHALTSYEEVYEALEKTKYGG